MKKVNLLDSTTKTLVFLGIVVLEGNLKLHGLGEFTLFLLRALEYTPNGLIQGVPRYLTVSGACVYVTSERNSKYNLTKLQGIIRRLYWKGKRKQPYSLTVSIQADLNSPHLL